MDDISILHKICLPFLPVLSGSLNRSHGLPALAKIVKILVCYNLRLDEAFFEITVNHSRYVLLAASGRQYGRHKMYQLEVRDSLFGLSNI